jgi:hypothetical protein
VTGACSIDELRDLSWGHRAANGLAAALFFGSQETEYVRDFAQLLPFLCTVQRGAANRQDSIDAAGACAAFGEPLPEALLLTRCKL